MLGACKRRSAPGARPSIQERKSQSVERIEKRTRHPTPQSRSRKRSSGCAAGPELGCGMDAGRVSARRASNQPSSKLPGSRSVNCWVAHPQLTRAGSLVSGREAVALKQSSDQALMPKRGRQRNAALPVPQCAVADTGVRREFALGQPSPTAIAQKQASKLFRAGRRSVPLHDGDTSTCR